MPKAPVYIAPRSTRSPIHITPAVQSMTPTAQSPVGTPLMHMDMDNKGMLDSNLGRCWNCSPPSFLLQSDLLDLPLLQPGDHTCMPSLLHPRSSSMPSESTNPYETFSRCNSLSSNSSMWMQSADVTLPELYNSPPSTNGDCCSHGRQHSCTGDVKTERRKAQNRVAQKAYRERQQKTLIEALQKIEEIKSELADSIMQKEHFRLLYEDLQAEYQRLWNEVANGSSPPSPTSEKP